MQLDSIDIPESLIEQKLNVENTVAQLYLSRICALAFQKFYVKTSILPSLSLSINKDSLLECNFSFSKEPTQEQAALFFHELKEAEKFLISKSIIEDDLPTCSTINQLLFRHKEVVNHYQASLEVQN